MNTKIEEMCKRINNGGCRVAIPQNKCFPVAVMFDGIFDNAEYINGQLNHTASPGLCLFPILYTLTG